MLANQRRCDDFTRCALLNGACNLWLSTRLELIGTAIVVSACAAAALAKGRVEPGLAGLAISYALKITGTLSWMVRMVTDAETQMNSVERVAFYSALESESPHEVLEVDAELRASGWPQRGELLFEKVVMRYAPHLEPSLKGIDLRVRAGEKVGVVGRTGAGKSSLAVVIFRLVEASSGRVLIDAVDTRTVGLHLLRSQLGIIAQEPVLFNSSIRRNLDPLGEHTNAAIWNALEQAHMSEHVRAMDGQLNARVTDGGSNLSVGQRQLLCLARVMLKRARIVLLDEATAAVDVATDKLIQDTIRRNFQHCTLITIAHRLNTVINSDLIVVLSDGVIAEHGTPTALLSNPRSHFSRMIQHSKPATAAKLRSLAAATPKPTLLRSRPVDAM